MTADRWTLVDAPPMVGARKSSLLFWRRHVVVHGARTWLRVPGVRARRRE
jgi:hypothetical protein